jgi:hypothetical protein
MTNAFEFEYLLSIKCLCHNHLFTKYQLVTLVTSCLSSKFYNHLGPDHRKMDNLQD